MLYLDSLQSFEFLHLWDAALHAPSCGTALNTSFCWRQERRCARWQPRPSLMGSHRLVLHPSTTESSHPQTSFTSLVSVDASCRVTFGTCCVLVSFIFVLVLLASPKGIVLAGNAAEGIRFQPGPWRCPRSTVVSCPGLSIYTSRGSRSGRGTTGLPVLGTCEECAM